MLSNFKSSLQGQRACRGEKLQTIQTKTLCAFIPLNSFYKCWAQTFEHKGIGKMSALLGKSNKATLSAPKKSSLSLNYLEALALSILFTFRTYFVV